MGGKKLIRRADGSYSPRGLWDNIRANRGSGKKPTKEMLEQESKIKNSQKMGGKRKLMKKVGKKKNQLGGMKADTTGVPGANSKMVTGDTTAAVPSAAGPAVSADKAAPKRAPKKKGMGGNKMSYMKKGGKKKQSKMMYEKGGFLSEPSVFDLDND